LNQNLQPHGNIIGLLDFLKSEHEFFREQIGSVRNGDTENIIQRGVDTTDDPIIEEIISKINSKKSKFLESNPRKKRKQYSPEKKKKPLSPVKTKNKKKQIEKRKWNCSK